MNKKFDVIYRMFCDESNYVRTPTRQLAYYIKNRDKIIELVPDFIVQFGSDSEYVLVINRLISIIISNENNNTRTRIMNEMRKRVPMRCPEKGEFIGYKKIILEAKHTYNGRAYIIYGIAKLRIPETAQRSSAFGSKCRCSEAFVEEIASIDGSIKYDSAVSVRGIDKILCWYNPVAIDDTVSVSYIVGKTVKPDSFDPNWWNECSNGIHFFMTRKEAEKYIP